jgi:hypothetical protein
MLTMTESMPVKVGGTLVGEIVPAKGGYYKVKGMDAVWPSPEEARRELLERREAAARLAQSYQDEQSHVPVVMGRSLYEAILEEGLWLGPVIDQTHTQITIRVEHKDRLRAALSLVMDKLTPIASMETRTEKEAMRARALLGAARMLQARI